MTTVANLESGEPTPARRGASISLSGLRKTFISTQGEVEALAPTDLEVAPGGFLCIVGPSGCGKTTLLRMLARLETPTAGTLSIDAAGWAVESAMVFQEHGLFPWMTIADNVEFGLRSRGVGQDERRELVAAALAMVGLSRFPRHYPHQVSGGMKQRASIARAFVTNPAMLLMDEPFASLDAQNRILLQGELVRLWESTRKTVVYITHSLEEALVLGDRAIVMTAQPGRIKEEIVIPFARPRDVLGVSLLPEFAALRLHIWQILETEVLKARQELEGE